MNKDTKELTTQRIRGNRLRNALLIRSSQPYPIKPKLSEIDLQKEGGSGEDNRTTDGGLAGAACVVCNWSRLGVACDRCA
jgi:hypothetical protein